MTTFKIRETRTSTSKGQAKTYKKKGGKQNMISEWDAYISTKHTTFMIFVSGSSS